MKFSLHRRAIAAAIWMVSSVLFFGCYKSNNGTGNTTPVAGLMAFNLTTDKSIGVALSGNPLTNIPLSFTNYTGSYLSVTAGSWIVQSYEFGTSHLLDSASFDFASQRYYSAFVTGAGGHYQNIIVRDNFDSLKSGNAYVRYLNAIPDSSSPTVTISDNGTNMTSNPASSLSLSNFTAVTPGNVTIQVNNGGTINKTRTFTFAQQKAYTVLLVGTPGSTGNDSLQIRFAENGSF